MKKKLLFLVLLSTSIHSIRVNDESYTFDEFDYQNSCSIFTKTGFMAFMSVSFGAMGGFACDKFRDNSNSVTISENLTLAFVPIFLTALGGYIGYKNLPNLETRNFHANYAKKLIILKLINKYDVESLRYVFNTIDVNNPWGSDDDLDFFVDLPIQIYNAISDGDEHHLNDRYLKVFKDQLIEEIFYLKYFQKHKHKIGVKIWNNIDNNFARYYGNAWLAASSRYTEFAYGVDEAIEMLEILGKIYEKIGYYESNGNSCAR